MLWPADPVPAINPLCDVLSLCLLGLRTIESMTAGPEFGSQPNPLPGVGHCLRGWVGIMRYALKCSEEGSQTPVSPQDLITG